MPPVNGIIAIKGLSSLKYTNGGWWKYIIVANNGDYAFKYPAKVPKRVESKRCGNIFIFVYVCAVYMLMYVEDYMCTGMYVHLYPLCRVE